MQQKRVLITGASRGIGRNLALHFARAGADVIVSARSEADLAAVAAEIEALGAPATAVVCDVSDAAAVAELQRQVTAVYGGVDVLVNNAGQAASHKFIDHPDPLWQQMLDVNLTSVYLVSKAFAGGMVEQRWGRIINMASIAGRIGGKYIAAYSAAKHGVLGLTRALAIELAPHVTVNAICPGYVDTPMTARTIANIVARTGLTAAQAEQALTQDTLQKRLIEPDEISAVALLLAGDAGYAITGQAINVDAGHVMV